jgi:hypothetical protein
MYTCPENHQSDTPDYCSVCGVAIAGGSAETPAAAMTGQKCPECETPKERPDQIFCEVCGYNYRTRGSGVPTLGGGTANPAAEEVVAPPAPAPAAVQTPQEPLPTGARWDVVVKVDPALYGKPNPAAPVQQPAQTFTLFETETMIGRAGTEVRVHIPIQHDPGISRRHALLTRQADGSLVVRDLGSANGTQLNGVDVVPGVDTPVKDGDSLSLGAWTRITLHALTGKGTP